MDERYREWRAGWEAPPEPPYWPDYDLCPHCGGMIVDGICRDCEWIDED